MKGELTTLTQPLPLGRGALPALIQLPQGEELPALIQLPQGEELPALTQPLPQGEESWPSPCPPVT